MKRPCSQACRLSAKYGRPAPGDQHDQGGQGDQAEAGGDARRHQAEQRPRAGPIARPSSACRVVQAKACSGPKLSAVDSVVAAPPQTTAPATTAIRRQPQGDRERTSRGPEAQDHDRELARRRHEHARGRVGLRPVAAHACAGVPSRRSATKGWIRRGPGRARTARGREEQADRPQDEQRDAAGAALDEPSVAGLLPARDVAAPMQQQPEADAEGGARAFIARSTFDETRPGR